MVVDKLRDCRPQSKDQMRNNGGKHHRGKHHRAERADSQERTANKMNGWNLLGVVEGNRPKSRCKLSSAIPAEGLPESLLCFPHHLPIFDTASKW